MDTITNALSAEEKPILENIVSLIQQLLSMQGTAQPAPEETVAEGEDTEGDTEMEELDVGKSSDGETGDDDAETRLDEQTDTTEEAMGKLQKSIELLSQKLNGKKTVVKPQTNPTMVALKKIGSTLNEIMKHQKNQDEVIKEIIGAVNITDDIINKNLPEDRKPEDKPVQRMDANFVKDLAVEIAKAVGGRDQIVQPQNPMLKKRGVNKNLLGIIQYAHEGSKAKTRP